MTDQSGKSGTNRMAVPEAKSAMNRFKEEVASELGVPLKEGYNGDLTSLKNSIIADCVVQGVSVEEGYKRFEQEGGAEWSQAIVDSLNNK